MRILHVVAGIWKNSGGLAELVLGFAVYQQRSGHRVSVAFVDGDRHPLMEKAEAEGVAIYAFRPAFPGFLFFSREMMCRLPALVGDADAVHVHSNWTFPVWWTCRAAIRRRKPFVMSPQGCLDPTRLAFSAWKKRLAGFFFDRRYLKAAAAIHATCEAEADAIRAYFRRYGLGCDPTIAIIPNGVNTDLFSGAVDSDFWVKRIPKARGKRILLYLGRLHPLKGLAELVKTWYILNQRHLDTKQIAPSRALTALMSKWHLVIAGPDEQGMAEKLRQQIGLFQLSDSVTLCGPFLGAERHAAMTTADLFILPTRHDNFAIAVAESLYCGTPAVATTGAPWSELNGTPIEPSFAEDPTADFSRFIPQAFLRDVDAAGNDRCGVWCEKDECSMASALYTLMRLSPETRELLGIQGRALISARYTWPQLAEKMLRLYSSF